jgi:hypothetical protein
MSDFNIASFQGRPSIRKEVFEESEGRRRAARRLAPDCFNQLDLALTLSLLDRLSKLSVRGPAAGAELQPAVQRRFADSRR